MNEEQKKILHRVILRTADGCTKVLGTYTLRPRSLRIETALYFPLQRISLLPPKLRDLMRGTRSYELTSEHFNEAENVIEYFFEEMP